ncbi:glycoside hydrolase family 32 protein [Pseudomonas rhizoryzae]|uniref:glycoside hydrolase family 32 protein n=1 Tax=Pseudomonas rhizoryzae TaxID=2571129 RepID=UPI000736E0CC|nr:glycoside hydrolase family 32 protein [Pseudomonas rhizoryzae]KTT30049.1 glycosyl hydrolase family 32 [Pseudomonas psychrotolerans]KTT72367.1 glycosyl hydrolase family 32 [Pseudomonas psychrotolerans]
MLSSALSKARAAILEQLEQRHDAWRPAYHLAPPVGWMNDPNGLVFFRGEYHVFYQYHPYSTKWGPMHWGHAKSADLVHWEHLPVALAPDTEADRDGCFSGSAVVWEDRLYLLYTGHRWLGEPGREDQGLYQVQCLASSRDGLTFTKHGTVIEPPVPEMQHFRDPKVWRRDDAWWLALGAREGDDPRLLLYRSSDLHTWEALGTALGGTREQDGYMWECPDLFPLGDEDVFLCSPQGLRPLGYRYRNLYQNAYRLGRLTDAARFLPRTGFIELDHGHDFYAAQTLEAPDGRRLLWAWLDMWESPMPSQADGWCGMLSLPREVSLDGDRLRQRPVRELVALRESEHSFAAQRLQSERRLLPLAGERLELEIEIDLAASDAERFGLALRVDPQGREETLLYVDAQAGRLVLDRERAGRGVAGVRSLPLAAGQTTLHLRLYLDRSSLEVFVDDGLYTFGSRLYPGPDSHGIALFASNGSALFNELHGWTLRDLAL